MFHSSRAEALESLDLIEGVDADVLLPGHGPSTGGRSERPPRWLASTRRPATAGEQALHAGPENLVVNAAVRG